MRSKNGNNKAHIPKKLKKLLVLVYRAETNGGNVNFAAIWKFMLKNNMDYKALAQNCGLTEEEITAVLYNDTKDETLIKKVAQYMRVEPAALMIRPPAADGMRPM